MHHEAFKHGGLEHMWCVFQLGQFERWVHQISILEIASCEEVEDLKTCQHTTGCLQRFRPHLTVNFPPLLTLPLNPQMINLLHPPPPRLRLPAPHSAEVPSPDAVCARGVRRLFSRGRGAVVVGFAGLL